MTMRIPTAVLISGTGSNMMALVNAAKDTDYPAEIRLVVSNRPEAAGLQRAADTGIATACIDHKTFDNREAFERAVDARLRSAGIELVALAGFMRVLTPWFVERWSGRLVNIHPSLLPKHKGLDTHARAISAGDLRHGASVHWVSEELDGGDVIAQDSFDMPANATSKILADLIKPLEHSLYPRALAVAARDVASRFTDG